MLSLSSLLNPISTSESRWISLPSSSPSYYSHLSPNESPRPSGQQSSAKSKMSKDGAVFFKGKVMGTVMFPPFENLDPESVREVQKYKVFPLGEIVKYPRHIPYNSEKKSFLEKTGRHSFEVFQYTFRLPGEEKEHTVMWDYNIGLVRITPFFKCCNYSKTIPAKMLNMNPGLKEITHSITGGALAAQGYWMPYPCAMALCATFCANIAGALIPIFGPSFPSQCTHRESPLCGRMVIEPSVIIHGTKEAIAFRSAATNGPTSNPSSSASQNPTPSPSQRTVRTIDSVSPRSTPNDFPVAHEQATKRLKPKCRGPLRGESTDTESETSMPYQKFDRAQFSGPPTPMTAYTPLPSSPASGYTSSGWTAANTHPQVRFAQQNKSAFSSNAKIASREHEIQRQAPSWRPRALRHPPTPPYPATPNQSPVASPWLSAIPRTVGDHGFGAQALNQNTLPPMRHRGLVGLGIRGVGMDEEVYDADSDGSPNVSPKRIKWEREVTKEVESQNGSPGNVEWLAKVNSSLEKGVGEEEKSAALMLMCLSVGEGNGTAQGMKRKRAASL
ncbi:hypothetical protein VE01_09938 [Pseudogymnoascus verrucosus]|uniref:HTH APSES-type domain-containing protein n=1 Tax=Pseudogymnoascus verrucosus TaxID=342668 RepID=A0A1B8G800_9PEZI|nr:uncharacterized protein VE01_09938 [Pseudogymnoascus verrucosus]OBT91956.2 hypothetical protein VE01_09938 [Pseudogymnoascus verrucosus]